MIIHDPEAFELWLATTLEPLCDADPAALAKYVCALVKKEKPLSELRTTMVQQLDVFLLLKTQSFVDRLISMLETQSQDSPKQQPAPLPPLPKTPLAVAPPPPPELPPAGVPEAQPPPVAVSASQQGDGATRLPLAYQPVNGAATSRGGREERSRSRHRKTDSEKESDKVRRRHNSPVVGRARSRSKSWDRSRRTRSREREMRRERDRSRAWRNKSPPPRRPYDRERRRSWSKSPVDVPRNHSRSRSRSPPSRPAGGGGHHHHHRGRYRNRSPPGGAGSRSRTRSPDHKEPVSGGGTPTQDSNHGDVDMRLTTTSQSIQSVVGKADTTAGPTGTFQGKGRCYDFDEKGYCMQGDLCQFDHGVDPVVLEDVALSNMLTFGPTPPPPGTGASPLPRLPPAPDNTRPPGEPPLGRGCGGGGPRPPNVHGFQHQHRVPPPTGNMEYNPDAPAMEPRGMTWVPRPSYRGGRGMRGPRPMHYHVAPQRELISVPVQGEEPYRPAYGRGGYNSESKDMGMKKRAFDFTRLGPRHKTPHNCSLELKKVPRGLNNITHLNNHFAKFGKIVNIQVSFENDPEAALVTFSSHAEANAAYRSTEAVLNNRFIKVFWHTPNNNNNSNNNNNNIQNEPGNQVQEKVPPARQSVKERLGAPPAIAHNTLQPKLEQQEPADKVVIADGTITKTLYIPTALKKTAPPAVPVKQENKANTAAAVKRSQDLLEARVRIKRLQQNKQKDSIKLSMNLRKRKQSLLDNHIKQLNLLIECAEKKGQSDEQKGVLMSTIRQVQATVERLRKELQGAVTVAASMKTMRAVIPPASKLKINVVPLAASTPLAIAKTKEQAQREILDAELDLYTRQQEGGDTTELQRRVNELRLESSRLLGLSVMPTRGGGRGRGLGARGSFRGRVRTNYNMAHSSVDHRPTRVLVSGYENDEKVDVITHFRQYGEISDFMCDDATPSVILNYKTRKEAETAMLKGRNFQDRVLSVTWCTQQSARGHVMSTVLLRHRSMSMASGTDEGHLLGEDVEEEEDTGLADYNEDLLLQDDEEEEEEEDEEKSWRR